MQVDEFAVGEIQRLAETWPELHSHFGKLGVAAQTVSGGPGTDGPDKLMMCIMGREIELRLVPKLSVPGDVLSGMVMCSIVDPALARGSHHFMEFEISRDGRTSLTNSRGDTYLSLSAARSADHFQALSILSFVMLEALRVDLIPLVIAPSDDM